MRRSSRRSLGRFFSCTLSRVASLGWIVQLQSCTGPFFGKKVPLRGAKLRNTGTKVLCAACTGPKIGKKVPLRRAKSRFTRKNVSLTRARSDSHGETIHKTGARQPAFGKSGPKASSRKAFARSFGSIRLLRRRMGPLIDWARFPSWVPHRLAVVRSRNLAIDPLWAYASAADWWRQRASS